MNAVQFNAVMSILCSINLGFNQNTTSLFFAVMVYIVFFLSYFLQDDKIKRGVKDAN